MKKTLGMLSLASILLFFTPFSVNATGISRANVDNPPDQPATGTTITQNFASGCTSNCITIAGFIADSSDFLTSATANGASATCYKVQAPSYRWQYLCYVLGQTGTYDWVFHFSSSPSFFAVGLAAYSGVDQGGEDGHSTKTGTTVSSLAVPETITTANSWQTMWCGDNNGGAESAGSGTTLISGGSTNFALYDSNGGLSAGSQSLNMNLAGSGNVGCVILSFAPAAGVAFNFWQFFDF